MNDIIDDLPKPQFKDVGAFYQAVVAMEFPIGKLNRDTSDTVMRELVRGARRMWGVDHPNVVRMWGAGGDEWSQFIKDVKSYSGLVNQHRRDLKKAEKIAEKNKS